MGLGGQHHAPATFTPGKDPVPIVQEAGWAPRAGLDGCGKSRPHRDSIPRVQPVASRYIDYAIPAPIFTVHKQRYKFGRRQRVRDQWPSS